MLVTIINSQADRYQKQGVRWERDGYSVPWTRNLDYEDHQKAFVS